MSRLTKPRSQTPRGRLAGFIPRFGYDSCRLPRTSPPMSATEEKVVEKTEKRERPEPTDQISITRHRLKTGKREIAYTATCGTVVLREETEKDGKHEGDKARAKVFFIAYTLDDVADKATRPVTFSFNGGPGSSSVWLHLGVLGPRRVALDDEGRAPQPPGGLGDNEFTLPA